MGAEEMPKDRSGPGEAWWRDAVIYEIAAISFQDSNGDGYGDLPGLLQRIDYLKWLGVGAVWLTPICTSSRISADPAANATTRARGSRKGRPAGAA